MGCDRYTVEDNHIISFSEMDDGGCLCTFPHNYGETLDMETVRLLAMLGAAVVLIHHGKTDSPVFLPYGIPEWIVRELDRLCR